MNKPFEIVMQGIGYRRWEGLYAAGNKQNIVVLKVSPHGTGIVKLTVISFTWSKWRLFRFFQRLYLRISHSKSFTNGPE